MSDLKRTSRTIRSNLIAGVFTVIPLLVVWLVLDFVFAFLFAVGSPVAAGLTMFIDDRMPSAVPVLNDALFQWLVAILMALLLLYTIGAIASRVLGRKVIDAVEGLIGRIPVVETVYSASKKLIGVLQQKPDGAARVVLIEFPHAGMKAIGLVMRLFTDAVTGEELAAVFVPTTPNPTSGYLEIVPVRSLVPTTMTMDQAMTMIVSGGAVAPENFSITPGPLRSH
ncbi:MAG TPA: DUF502 domain-containing protein [Micropepsaceae bacterium]|nr:DUF502 domain-containing protein [Micropepsaceae bacterium]